MFEGDAIDRNWHHLSRLGRAALGHYEDQREVIDHPDGGEEEDYPDHVFELRQRYVEEAPEHVGPIDVRGLVQLGGHALQTGQQHDGDVGHEAPDIGHHHRAHSCVWLGQPRDIGVDEAEAQERVIDEAEAVVEEPAPHVAGHHWGDGPGDEQKAGKDRPILLDLVEDQRHAQA